MKLKPIGSNQTVLETSNGNTVLFSYSTPVAAKVAGRGIVKTRKFHSSTTSKHINAWIKKETGFDSYDSIIELVEQEDLDEMVKQ